MIARKAIALCAVFALVAVLAWVAVHRREPSYHGKGLTAWLRDLEHWGGDTNDPAIVAFQAMGASAVPALVKAIKSEPSPIQKAIWKLNQKQPVVKIPVHFSSQEMAASSALYAIGPNARPVFPLLTNWLFHTNHVITSGTVLAGIGSDGIAILLVATTNQNWIIRYAAVSSLGYARSDLDVVVPMLITLLQDQHPKVRHASVISLGQLHMSPDLVVPALIKDFSANNMLLKALILTSLGQFGTNGREAIPVIVGALKESDELVRHSAEAALKKIDSAAAERAGLK